MAELEHSVWIACAPDVLWHAYVDPARIPEWQTGGPVIEEVRGAPGAVGSSYVSRRGRLRARTTVLASEEPRELVTSTDAYFGLRFEVASRLSPQAGGTELRILATTDARRGMAPLVGLVARVVLSPVEARKELDALKALVEGEAA